MTMPYKKSTLAFTDIDGSLRPRIKRILDGTPCNMADFLRDTIIDRVEEIEEANRRVAQEKKNRRLMACATTFFAGRPRQRA